MRLIFLFGLIAAVSCNESNDTSRGHRVTHKVWFDITVGGDYLGRIEFGLFGRIVPITVTNFMNLATRPKGQGYKGSRMHMVNEEFIAGGDWVRGNGDGGRSSYDDPRFERENFKIKHYGAGWISSDPYGIFHTSLFVISLKKLTRFEGICVVFGKVLKGMDHVWNITKVPRNDKTEVPSKEVIILDCGGKIVDPPFFTPKTEATD